MTLEWVIVTGPSAVTLEWTALGSPLRNFGFSNWSTDFLSARQTCAQQVGNVSLASLGGGVEGLHGYLQQVFPQRQFWVDATRSGKYSHYKLFYLCEFTTSLVATSAQSGNEALIDTCCALVALTSGTPTLIS